jgi:hypothetical protein
MPDTFDPTSVTEFEQGILKHDTGLVASALKKGVRADTSVGGKHPLIALMLSAYEDLPEADKKKVAEAQFEQSTRDIVKRLFDGGMKVAEEGKHKTDFLPYLADRFLLNPDTESVADIVIHAIAETLKDGRPVYQPNIPNFVANFLAAHGDEQLDVPGVANAIVNSISGVYDAVRERLDNPKTPLEKEVAANGKVEIWRSPLDRPGLDDLLKQIGLNGGRYNAAEGPHAGQDFEQAAPARGIPVKDYLTVIEKRDPFEILKELKAEVVGHAALQRELKQLALHHLLEEMTTARGLPADDLPQLNTAYVGPEGVGKGTLAQKQVELLVSLGIAGPSHFAITEENLARVAGSTSPESLAKIFAHADTIIVEVPPSPEAPSQGAPELGKTFMIALQMSLQPRKQLGKDDPIVFITGARDDIETLYDQVPALKTLVPNVRQMAELSDEQLCEALTRKLGKKHYKIDADGQTLLQQQLHEARQRFGNDFRNAKEVDVIAKKLPYAMAERLLGDGEENEATIITAPTDEALHQATAADIKALNIPKIIGGLAHVRRRKIGFGE